MIPAPSSRTPTWSACLRRPCKYDADDEYEDKTLAIVDVAKQRNGPTGEVRLNFEEDYTRFRDREHGVDGYEELEALGDDGAEVEEPWEAESK